MNTSDTRFGSGAMFDRIAHRYDVLNRVISLGVDERWRRQAVDCLGLHEAPASVKLKVLDLATGTGDLAIQIARRFPNAELVGLDPSREMLRAAKRKTKQLPIGLICGSAEELPLESDSFDACTMAFGIRNVPNRVAALHEIARVVRPGGRVAILELGEPRSGWVAAPARFYVRRLIPWLGRMLSGASEYQYLAESMARFPKPEKFVSTMQECGLQVRDCIPFMFGACHLYVAEA